LPSAKLRSNRLVAGRLEKVLGAVAITGRKAAEQKREALRRALGRDRNKTNRSIDRSPPSARGGTYYYYSTATNIRPNQAKNAIPCIKTAGREGTLHLKDSVGQISKKRELRTSRGGKRVEREETDVSMLYRAMVPSTVSSTRAKGEAPWKRKKGRGKRQHKEAVESRTAQYSNR